MTGTLRIALAVLIASLTAAFAAKAASAQPPLDRDGLAFVMWCAGERGSYDNFNEIGDEAFDDGNYDAMSAAYGDAEYVREEAAVAGCDWAQRTRPTVNHRVPPVVGPPRAAH